LPTAVGSSQRHIWGLLTVVSGDVRPVKSGGNLMMLTPDFSYWAHGSTNANPLKSL